MSRKDQVRMVPLLKSPSLISRIPLRVWRDKIESDCLCDGVMLKSSLYITELLAFIRGEECDESLINMALTICSARPKEEFVGGEVVTLKCLDGELRYSLIFLKRSFYLFDDFFSTHNSEISIPFTKTTVARALNDCCDIPLLVEVSECLDYFQSKNPLLFLDYDPSGCSGDIIRRHSLRLSNDDREKAYKMNRLHSSFHIVDLLASFEETEWSFLFSNYRYTMALIDAGEFENHPSLEALLRVIKSSTGIDYSIIFNYSYHSDPYRPNHTSNQLEEGVLRLFADRRVENKKTLSKLMAMFDIRHSLLENENDPFCLPYHIKPRLEDKVNLIHSYGSEIEEFFDITIEEAFELFLPIQS